MEEGGVQFPVGPRRVGRTAIAQLSKSCGSIPLGVRIPHPPPMPLFKRTKKPQVTSRELIKRVQVLEEQLQETTKELAGLKKRMLGILSKVGIVRFNAFREIGGDQSFSIALLDEKRNGAVITSYYGRDLNRVYAKPIENGTSRHELAEEEKNAIAQAIGPAPKRK